MSPWLPFVYDYAVGGLFFVASLVAGYMVGAIDLRRPNDRLTLVLLVGGLCLFATIHAVWIAAVSATAAETAAH